MKPLLLRHLAGEKVGRFPVWMMRQAGRYLPRYRAIREKYSFWQMATMPEVAAEVSLLPLEELPVDGIILFSDILTLPYGMGLPIEMQESVGPVLKKPLKTVADFSLFESYRPSSHTPFVGEALKLIRKGLSPDIAVLGFAGAPWTVACYLIEGKPGKNFEGILQWLHRDPAGLAQALGTLADATIAYLKSQKENGADVIQLFDTWLSDMPRPFFVEHYLPILNRIFDALKGSDLPVIYFSKHAHHLVPDFSKLTAPILSVDSLLPLTEFEARTGEKFSLQGNLDPTLLFCEEGIVRRETRKLVQEARRLRYPAILNLGHGVLPKTPVPHVKAFFEEARALWL